ncbi:hypothetical protein [Hyphococcus sp.]|uniref:hypothetical protein n=1 Tax=Hyphococcus sp. TaxID=2038636 RepID=UPI003CCB8808
MLSRIIIFAAAAIGSGVLLGRKAINKKIEERLPVEIETARKAAIAELDKRTGQVIYEKLSAFGVNLCVKAGAIAFPYWMYLEGHLTDTGLHIIIITLIIVFVLRDALKTLPFMAPALQLVRMHSWNPRRALTEFVAGVAFEKTYAEAMLAMETGPNRLWLALSKYSAHNVSREVAEAVAEIARTTSYDRIKPRALLAGALAVVMMAVYAAFLYLTIGGGGE